MDYYHLSEEELEMMLNLPTDGLTYSSREEETAEIRSPQIKSIDEIDNSDYEAKVLEEYSGRLKAPQRFFKRLKMKKEKMDILAQRRDEDFDKRIDSDKAQEQAERNKRLIQSLVGWNDILDRCRRLDKLSDVDGVTESCNSCRECIKNIIMMAGQNFAYSNREQYMPVKERLNKEIKMFIENVSTISKAIVNNTDISEETTAMIDRMKQATTYMDENIERVAELSFDEKAVTRWVSILEMSMRNYRFFLTESEKKEKQTIEEREQKEQKKTAKKVKKKPKKQFGPEDEALETAEDQSGNYEAVLVCNLQKLLNRLKLEDPKNLSVEMPDSFRKDLNDKAKLFDMNGDKKEFESLNYYVKVEKSGEKVKYRIAGTIGVPTVGKTKKGDEIGEKSDVEKQATTRERIENEYGLNLVSFGEKSKKKVAETTFDDFKDEVMELGEQERDLLIARYLCVRIGLNGTEGLNELENQYYLGELYATDKKLVERKDGKYIPKRINFTEQDGKTVTKTSEDETYGKIEKDMDMSMRLERIILRELI
ncbi:MAG: hypothetical protein K6E95_01490 [Lachnospiraceae bacterium]|nr:hypothetical protein [Lachnospiraceae bacterium]